MRTASEPTEMGPELTKLASYLPQSDSGPTQSLPPELRARVTSLGRRPRTAVIQDLIASLCSVRQMPNHPQQKYVVPGKEKEKL